MPTRRDQIRPQIPVEPDRVHHNDWSRVVSCSSRERMKGAMLGDARDDVLLQFLRRLSPTVNWREIAQLLSLAPRPLPLTVSTCMHLVVVEASRRLCRGA